MKACDDNEANATFTSNSIMFLNLMSEVRHYLVGSDSVYFPFRRRWAMASVVMDINNSFKDAIMAELAIVSLLDS